MAKGLSFTKMHPVLGATLFPQSLLLGLGIDYTDFGYLNQLYELNKANISNGNYSYSDIRHEWAKLTDVEPKYTKLHTIRFETQYEKGQMVQPYYWIGRPYYDPQFRFAPPVEIKQLIQVEMIFHGPSIKVLMDGLIYTEYNPNDNSNPASYYRLKQLAINDALDLHSFFTWFMPPKPSDKPVTKTGQILCFTDKPLYHELLNN